MKWPNRWRKLPLSPPLSPARPQILSPSLFHLRHILSLFFLISSSSTSTNPKILNCPTSSCPSPPRDLSTIAISRTMTTIANNQGLICYPSSPRYQKDRNSSLPPVYQHGPRHLWCTKHVKKMKEIKKGVGQKWI